MNYYGQLCVQNANIHTLSNNCHRNHWQLMQHNHIRQKNHALNFDIPISALFVNNRLDCAACRRHRDAHKKPLCS